MYATCHVKCNKINSFPVSWHGVLHSICKPFLPPLPLRYRRRRRYRLYAPERIATMPNIFVCQQRGGDGNATRLGRGTMINPFIHRKLHLTHLWITKRAAVVWCLERHETSHHIPPTHATSSAKGNCRCNCQPAPPALLWMPAENLYIHFSVLNLIIKWIFGHQLRNFLFSSFFASLLFITVRAQAHAVCILMTRATLCSELISSFIIEHCVWCARHIAQYFPIFFFSFFRLSDGSLCFNEFIPLIIIICCGVNFGRKGSLTNSASRLYFFPCFPIKAVTN